MVSRGASRVLASPLVGVAPTLFLLIVCRQQDDETARLGNTTTALTEDTGLLDVTLQITFSSKPSTTFKKTITSGVTNMVFCFCVFFKKKY